MSSPPNVSISEFVTFRINSQLYGIPIILVREINRHLDVTPVQNGAAFIHGLANLRGRIITVLDTAVRLGLQGVVVNKGSHCIVLKTDSELLTSPVALNRPELLAQAAPDLLALLVESIGEVVRCHETAFEPVPANVREPDNRFLAGVFKLEDELLLVLEMQTLLKAE